jgi:hypothetical protein
VIEAAELAGLLHLEIVEGVGDAVAVLPDRDAEPVRALLQRHHVELVGAVLDARL